MFNRLNISHYKDQFVGEELIFSMDMILSVVASVIVMLGVELVFPDLFHTFNVVLTYLLTVFLVSFALFILFGTYKIIIRHLGAKDIITFAYVSASVAAFVFVFVVYDKEYN